MHCVFLYYQEGLANLYDTLIYDLEGNIWRTVTMFIIILTLTIKSGVYDQDGPAWDWAG